MSHFNYSQSMSTFSLGPVPGAHYLHRDPDSKSMFMCCEEPKTPIPTLKLKLNRLNFSLCSSELSKKLWLLWNTFQYLLRSCPDSLSVLLPRLSSFSYCDLVILIDFLWMRSLIHHPFLKDLWPTGPECSPTGAGRTAHHQEGIPTFLIHLLGQKT